MKTKNFDQVITKLEINATENPTNVKVFKRLQSKSIKLIDEFTNKNIISISSMRILLDIPEHAHPQFQW